MGVKCIAHGFSEEVSPTPESLVATRLWAGYGGLVGKTSLLEHHVKCI